MNKTNFLKLIFFAIILMVGTNSCKTNNAITNNINSEKVNLKWKVNDTIKYLTKMEPIEEMEFNVDFGKAFGNVIKKITKSIKLNNKDSVSSGFHSDSLKNTIDNIFKGDKSDLFKKIKSELTKNKNKTKTITYLTKSPKLENVINVEMINKKLSINDSIDKSFFSMAPVGTILKGSIYENGKLHSFWLNNGQRNLISLFFELPEKEVKKGDIWSLKNLNYIQYGNVFYCDKSEKKNEVKLVDLIKRNGETIAIIEYNIYEYTDGKMDLFGNKSPSKMEVKYNAKGEFSIDKGKWISYIGFLSIESEGFMSSKSKQKFQLIEK